MPGVDSLRNNLTRIGAKKDSAVAFRIGTRRLLLLIHDGIRRTHQEHKGRGSLCCVPALPPSRVFAQLRLCFLQTVAQESPIPEVSPASRSFVRRLREEGFERIVLSPAT